MDERRFAYNEQGESEPVELSYSEIIKEYFPYWSARMKSIGKESEISEDACVLDWCIVHCAWEIK